MKTILPSPAPKARSRRGTPATCKPVSRRVITAPQPTLPGTCGAVGIDVSKLSFNACVLLDKDISGAHGKFDASAEGHAKFIAWVQRVGHGQALHFCLEETGVYGRALAAFLHQAGHHVSLVNAALIKHHARSLNLRAKNDAVDARLIAHYTLAHVPARWQPPAPAHQHLRELSRRREQLGGMIVAERNHLEAALDPQVRAHITHVLGLLEAERDAIWKSMVEAVKADPALRHNLELLKSIPHLQDITAVKLLAELPPLDAFESSRQMCAYAGLTPRQEQSGTSVLKRTRLCKQGRSGLRSLLFMPALSVLGSKRSPLRPFADRLAANGKAPKCILGALMRKILATAFAILRSGVPFSSSYRSPIQPQA